MPMMKMEKVERFFKPGADRRARGLWDVTMQDQR